MHPSCSRYLNLFVGIDYRHPFLGGAFGPGKKVIGGYDFVGDKYDGTHAFEAAGAPALNILQATILLFLMMTHSIATVSS